MDVKHQYPTEQDQFSQFSSQPAINGLHANAAAFVPAFAPANGYSPTKNWDEPQEASVQGVPTGLDRDAYVAGERAAMARSLHMLLPSQQALGMLSGGLQRLEGQVQEESLQNRQTSLAAANAKTAAQALQDRLDNLERVRLPAMDSRIQHAIDAPLSQEFRATLQGLQGALENVHSRQSGPYSLTGSTTASYTREAISRADVAAVFLSRKILLDNKAFGTDVDVQRDEGQTLSLARPYAKAVFGSVLFLAAIEASWQLHSRVLNSIPSRMRQAVLPAKLGLRIARVATWAASLTLSIIYFRRVCYFLADSSISSIERALRIIYSKLPFNVQEPAAKIKASLSNATSETEDLQGSPGRSSETRDSPVQSCTPKFLAAGGQFPLPRQRSVFDTPPPSPPPNDS